MYYSNLPIGEGSDHTDSELDSGISVNGNYDQIENSNRNVHFRGLKGLQDYERIEEMQGKDLRFILNQ